MANGGKIAPDGRPAQAPGVGRNAKRHDLEGPAPRLHDTDLQQGEVAAAQQQSRDISRKQRQAPAKTPPRRQGARRASGQFSMEVPDPIEMAASRDLTAHEGDGTTTVDATAWVPLLEQLASVPGSSGGLTGMLLDQLSGYRNRPTVSVAGVIDLNMLDDMLEEGG